MVDGYANVFSSAATLKIGASRDLDYNGPAVWSCVCTFTFTFTFYYMGGLIL